MIILNLLPITDKKRIANHYLTLLIKDLIFSLLLIFSILAIMFLICHFMLIKNFILISQRNLSMIENTSLVTEDIRKINRDLKELKEVHGEYTNWMEFLIILNEQIPNNNIQITKLNIDKHQQTMLIEGKALKRDDFLILKENLETSEMFDSIQSPLSNLLTNKNINFSLEMKLKK